MGSGRCGDIYVKEPFLYSVVRGMADEVLGAVTPSPEGAAYMEVRGFCLQPELTSELRDLRVRRGLPGSHRCWEVDTGNAKTRRETKQDPRPCPPAHYVCVCVCVCVCVWY
jgi:hypothetical protein